jgi:hypothetical protein
MSVSNFDELIQQVKQENVKNGLKKKVAVMCADDEEVLAAMAEAYNSEWLMLFLLVTRPIYLKCLRRQASMFLRWK